MKLIIERPSYKSTVVIEEEYDDLTIDDVINDLFIPALKAMGYSSKNIDEIFNNK